jgi:hypothetical protein
LRIQDVYPGSRILIFIHPGFRFSDPGFKNSNKKEGRKKFFVQPVFVAPNITKLKLILFLSWWKMAQWAHLQKNQKIVIKLSNIFGLGSEIQELKKPILDPGFCIQGSKRHRVPDPFSGSATLHRSIHFCQNIFNSIL